MVLSSFFLLITYYATELYFLALALIILSLVFFFSAGVFGFQEVGLCNKADNIMVDYLKRRESETYEEDDYFVLKDTLQKDDSEDHEKPDKKVLDGEDILIIPPPSEPISEESHLLDPPSVTKRFRESFKIMQTTSKKQPQEPPEDSDTE